MAKPSATDDGELIDGGFDMSTGGMCGYLHDVLYITCFMQLGSIISGKFWYAYLGIPAFGTYKASSLVKGFLSHGSEGGVEDDKTRKRGRRWREKLLEGKSSRQDHDECLKHHLLANHSLANLSSNTQMQSERVNTLAFCMYLLYGCSCVFTLFDFNGCVKAKVY